MKTFAIFDFDGTLFDSVEDVMICLNGALAKHGFPTLNHEEYINRLGGNVDQIVSLILKDKNTAQNIEIVKETYEGLYEASPKENTLPFEGIKELLLELQERNVPLAINSNRGVDSISYFVDKLLSEIDFVAIEGYGLDCPSKPDSCGVERICRKFDVAKDDLIYVGDSSTDIKTAQNAEVDCLIVNWGYGFPQDYKNEYPLEVIENPSQILKYF